MPETTSTALRPSRPTVHLAGEESPSIAQGLLAMRIEESVSGISSCELAIGNWGPVGDGVGFLYFDRRDIDFGKALTVSVAGSILFSGRITGIEGQFPEGSPPSILLLAEDRLQALRMTRRTRTFENATDESVVRQIAGEHGLDADVSIDGPTHRVIAQVNQSDLAFIRERCRAADAEVWVEGTSLKVRRHAEGTGGSERLELGYGHELREFTVVADLAGQATEVAVGGWDVAGKTAILEKANSDATFAETGAGESGADILRTALGERKETVAHTAPIAGPEARAHAEALFRRRARRFVRGRGLAETSGRLRAGRTVKLAGLGRLFNGEYYVVDTRIVFDPIIGLRTEFTAERPFLGRP